MAVIGLVGCIHIDTPGDSGMESRGYDDRACGILKGVSRAKFADLEQGKLRLDISRTKNIYNVLHSRNGALPHESWYVLPYQRLAWNF